jgi:beta-glucosidase
MRRRLTTAISIIGAFACASSHARDGVPDERPSQPEVSARSIPILQIGGSRFRDANRNGRLDPYEDWRLPPARRADDLIARMTLPEKLGQMLHDSVPQRENGYNEAAARELILSRHITAMITRLAGEPGAVALANNGLQAIAEQGRLGIPLLLSSDPRNQLQGTTGASVAAGAFTPFPDPIGIAAIGDAEVTRRYADVIRREYRAVGIRMALSPQADLATEPRWPRIDGTFGEDPALAARMVGAFVEGLQGGAQGIGCTSVAAVVKHWAGYGAAANQGFDSHNRYGRFSAISPATLPAHIRPFLPALTAHVAGVMPMYSVPSRLRDAQGRPVPPVAAGYDHYLLTDLLRHRYGFAGVVLSDWKITDNCNAACRNGSPPGEPPNWTNAATSWGVETLSPEDRFAMAVRAGIDQFGGTHDAASLEAAIRHGKIPIAAADRSVRRILQQSFALGLFENPYVDADAAKRIVGAAATLVQGHSAQTRAMVVLQAKDQVLPLQPARSPRLYLLGVAPDAATQAGFRVVNDPAQADFAVVRLAAPFELLHPNFPAGAVQHEGSLAYQNGDPNLKRLRAIAAIVPTIVDVRLDRPAILTNLLPLADMLVVDFGATDGALMDGLTGKAPMLGRLPFELPSSMAAVEAQDPAVPHDSSKPLFPFGFRAPPLSAARESLKR